MNILHNKIARPTLALGVFLLLYTAYWFHMSGRITQEIEDWVNDQAQDGTEVTYASLNVTGYPFRLVATMVQPEIFVRDGDNRPHWRGEKLKAITQAYSLNHVILDFIGIQTIEVEENVGPMARPPSRQRYTLKGTSIMMSLKLNRSRILQADAIFEDLDILVEDYGDYRPIRMTDMPGSAHIDEAQIHSRVRPSEDPEGPRVTHDFAVEILGLTPEGSPPNGFEKTISRVALNISRTSDEEIGFHNGSLRLSREPLKLAERKIELHEVMIEWQPVRIGLSGKLNRPDGQKASGKVELQIKGHRDLIRVLAAQGDISTLSAILSGALLGIIEIAGETRDDGTLHVPLKIKKGNVSFGFLPLTSLDELEAATGL